MCYQVLSHLGCSTMIVRENKKIGSLQLKSKLFRITLYFSLVFIIIQLLITMYAWKDNVAWVIINFFGWILFGVWFARSDSSIGMLIVVFIINLILVCFTIFCIVKYFLYRNELVEFKRVDFVSEFLFGTVIVSLFIILFFFGFYSMSDLNVSVVVFAPVILYGFSFIFPAAVHAIPILLLSYNIMFIRYDGINYYGLISLFMLLLYFCNLKKVLQRRDYVFKIIGIMTLILCVTLYLQLTQLNLHRPCDRVSYVEIMEYPLMESSPRDCYDAVRYSLSVEPMKHEIHKVFNETYSVYNTIPWIARVYIYSGRDRNINENIYRITWIKEYGSCRNECYSCTIEVTESGKILEGSNCRLGGFIHYRE